MSKILKQNGTGGKIIRSQQTGKVLKQNYNFGKAWKGRQALAIYGELPFVIDSSIDSFSLLLYRKTISGSTNTNKGCGIYDASGNIIAHVEQMNRFVTNKTVINTITTKICQVMRYNAGSSTINFYFTELPGSDVGINAFVSSFFRIYTTILSTGYYSRISESRLYNKYLTDDEINYAINNNLGNDPLSGLQMHARHCYSGAEIFDNNYVGIRDINDTGRHIRLVNLPAGTLQEQLEYANTNLFELW